MLKSSEIEEIYNLDNLITCDIIYSKMIEDVKNICQSKIKVTLKYIIEKIDLIIEKTKGNLNNISKIINEIKEKLNTKARKNFK